MAVDTLERECCIRGYHVYKHIWEAAIGEELDCRREPDNPNDRYAVAVVKSETVVGHLPRRLSRVFSLLRRRDGMIECRVAGRRRYSQDLP